MTHAVVPIVGVMMGVLTWGFLKKTKEGLGWMRGMIILVGSFILMEIVHLHPGIVIGLLLIGALVAPDKKNKQENQVERKRNSL